MYIYIDSAKGNIYEIYWGGKRILKYNYVNQYTYIIVKIIIRYYNFVYNAYLLYT